MEVIPTPEVANPTGQAGIAGIPSAEISLNLNDAAKELAKIATEMGQSTPAPTESAPVVNPPQEPVTQPPQAVTEPAKTEQPPVVVPDKFKAPDGSLDTTKVAKSTVSAEATLQKYLALEKELKSKMNEVNKLNQYEQAQPNVPIQPQGQVQQQPVTFAQQLEADVQQYGLGVVMERVFEAATLRAREMSLSEIASVKEGVESEKSRRELQQIAETDPVIFTPEGFEAISKIRQENPWVNNSPRPYETAYKLYLAEQVQNQRIGQQVMTPNPNGVVTHKAPPASTTPAVHISQVNPAIVNVNDPIALQEHLNKLTPAQQADFFKSRGLPVF